MKTMTMKGLYADTIDVYVCNILFFLWRLCYFLGCWGSEAYYCAGCQLVWLVRGCQV